MTGNYQESGYAVGKVGGAFPLEWRQSAAANVKDVLINTCAHALYANLKNENVGLAHSHPSRCRHVFVL